MIILHRRIKLFLERWYQPVNLVDEEDVAFLKIGQERRDISSFLNRRTGRAAQLSTHFVGDDVRERRLTQTWRARQQNMIERFFATQGRLHVDPQIIFGVTLADVFDQTSRAQR